MWKTLKNRAESARSSLNEIVKAANEVEDEDDEGMELEMEQRMIKKTFEKHVSRRTKEGDNQQQENEQTGLTLQEAIQQR